MWPLWLRRRFILRTESYISEIGEGLGALKYILDWSIYWIVYWLETNSASENFLRGSYKVALFSTHLKYYLNPLLLSYLPFLSLNFSPLPIPFSPEDPAFQGNLPWIVKFYIYEPWMKLHSYLIIFIPPKSSREISRKFLPMLHLLIRSSSVPKSLIWFMFYCIQN